MRHFDLFIKYIPYIVQARFRDFFPGRLPVLHNKAGQYRLIKQHRPRAPGTGAAATRNGVDPVTDRLSEKR